MDILNRFGWLTLTVLLTLSLTGAPAHGDEETAADSMPGPAPQLGLNDYLARAIERGAPLFNQGMPQACAAVYGTALEAIAYSEGWGLPADQRIALEYQLSVSEAIGDPAERAWAYRRIIDSLLSGKMLELPAAADTRTLFDFSDPAEAQQWRVVLDGVMGGRSSGQVSSDGDTLVFTGETSLRNNGGFSSIRARLPDGSVAGYDALRIRVQGDGRTWILGASTRSNMRGDSYWTRFQTRAGEWLTVTVPVREMVRQYFGTPIEGRLQPAAVRGVEFYIYDKQAGPFRLQVDRIEAVRVGTGEATGSG